MKSGFVIALASALFAINGPGAAMTSEAADTAPTIKKTKKKPAKKVKVAMRKSTARTPPPKEDAAALAASLALYKIALAQRISDADPTRVYAVQPQALLRSVVVVRIVIGRDGKLISGVVQRSNDDPVTEAAALASLRGAAPFPKPPASLLTNGRLDILETWLFNDDGRFQIRSIAQVQKSE
jgi:protein TonB